MQMCLLVTVPILVLLSQCHSAEDIGNELAVDAQAVDADQTSDPPFSADEIAILRRGLNKLIDMLDNNNNNNNNNNDYDGDDDDYPDDPEGPPKGPTETPGGDPEGKPPPKKPGRKPGRKPGKSGKGKGKKGK